MKLRYAFCLFVFFCFLFTQKPGQQMDVHLKEELTTNDGLPSEEVYQVIQDKKKFLWFATNNGIVKYDGKNLRVFNSNDGLPNNTVFRLYEQPDGKIYGESHHNQFFYIENDSIYPYPYNNLLAQLMPGYCRSFSFYVDSLGNTCFGASNGYFVIDRKGKLVTNEDHLYDSCTSMVLKFMDRENYVFTYRSRLKDCPDLGPIVRVSPDGQEKTFPVNRTVASFDANYGAKISDQTYAILYKNAVDILDADTVRFSLVTKSRPVGVFMIDSLLWVGYLNDGVRAYDISGKEPREKYHIFANYSVTSVLKDHENGYWFSTRENGVIHLYDFDISKIYEGDASNNINCYYEDKNIKLVGFDNGLVWNSALSKKTGMYNLYIRSFEKLDDDRILFMIGNIPTVYSRSSGKSWPMLDNQQICPALIDINDSLLLLLRQTNVFLYEKRTQKKVQSFMNLPVIDKIQSACFLQDDIAIGSDKGLILIDTSAHLIKQNIRLSSPVVSLININSRLTIACTNGDFYSYSDNRLSRLALQGRAELSKIFDMGKVGDMMIVSTNLGILKYKYDFKNNTWSYYEFVNLPGVIKLKIIGRKIFYITRRAVYSDANLERNNFVPITYFSKIAVNGKTVPVNSGIQLEYLRNNIEFDVGSISYGANFLNFRYKLNGLESEYRHTADSRISYSSLNPGTYEFVISSTSNGIDFSPEERFSFTIRPPFWKTAWFITLCIVTGLSLLFFVYYRETRKNRIKSQMELSIANLKSQALSNQLNPHLVFNIMNSIQGMISEADTEKANLYLSRFAKFMRSSLASAKEMKVPLEEELALTQNYIDLELFRFPEDLSIHIENNVSSTDYFLPPLIIQPFIENAIKHGVRPSKNQKGDIRILIDELAGCLTITIEDNGVGFAGPINFVKGDGLRISKERLEILNPKNNIRLDNSSGKTRIIITVHK